MQHLTARPHLATRFEWFMAYLPFILVIHLLHSPFATGADGRTRIAFSVDAPFSEVVRKMDSEQSLAEVLSSQNIELVQYEMTERTFSPKTQTLDGQLQIRAFAPRFSSSHGTIGQTVRLGANQARLEFVLLEPLGQLAEHHYTVDFATKEEQTTVTIGLYSRVFVPRRRLCRVQRLVDRIARRRVAGEVQWAVAELQQAITTIVSKDRPADAKSILLN